MMDLGQATGANLDDLAAYQYNIQSCVATFKQLDVYPATYPPAVLKVIDAAQPIITRALEGGFFDKFFDGRLKPDGNLIRWADAATALLADPRLRVHAWACAGGHRVSIEPVWAHWGPAYTGETA